MLENINEVDEILKFFKDLMEKPNSKYKLAQIFGMAQRYEIQQKQEIKVEEMLLLSKGNRVVETILISEDIAIVKVEGTNKEFYYRAVVNEKKCSATSISLDDALIIALSNKYGVASYAPQAIRSILRIEEYESKKQPKTFVQRVVDGELTVDQLDDVIQEWHEGSCNLKLHEFLGLSPFEYQEGVVYNKGEVLINIIEMYKKITAQKK